MAENSGTDISFNETSTNYYVHTTAAEIAENMLSKNPSENQLWKVRCNPDIDYISFVFSILSGDCIVLIFIIGIIFPSKKPNLSSHPLLSKSKKYA